MRRFEQEQQLLAQLEHTGIAHIIDSGVAEGQPWIAMELVEGEAIDTYCDAQRLDLSQRLALFIKVAQSVQYAHSRLIIHRDIKPGNILVSDKQPKLLGFGIAKALQEAADPKVTSTLMLLTPQYASPEQALGEPVGVASDIYQLGLLFYRLLTGFSAQVRKSKPPENKILGLTNGFVWSGILTLPHSPLNAWNRYTRSCPIPVPGDHYRHNTNL